MQPLPFAMTLAVPLWLLADGMVLSFLPTLAVLLVADIGLRILLGRSPGAG